ncbi:MAG: uroporphyrinogen-III synthase [Actinobacteria bacterium]|nr:uroporphyrinogen-III synthase [Actinomycetota bacterium]
MAGRRFLVTRPAEEAAELADLLRAEGAEAIVAPTIRIEPLEGEALARLDTAARELADGAFEWVAFTSVRAVDAVLGRLAALGYGPFPAVVRARLAAIGTATADRLAEAGLRAELVPERFTTEGLAQAFPEGTGRVLTPRADVAPDGLEDALAARGWSPTRVDAYRTELPDALPDEALRALREGRIDAVVFTSASTVRGFERLVSGVGLPPAVCIGPVTAEAARAAGLEVAAVAEPHTVEGVVAALVGLSGRLSWSG